MNDNPRVFPDPMRGAESSVINQAPYELEQGLLLRDYFAAKALPAVMRDYNGTHKEALELDKETCENIAFYAYQIADSMLKQREL